ncbi:MAG: radical SAM protein [Mailhella sp.]|nr:radical SAM protein [Mailhella sp.]
MSDSIPFPVGARSRQAAPIVPVFLPFRGCPCRCVYCAQDRQTGEKSARGISRILRETAAAVERKRLPCELAFYGGTFTAMPGHDRRACLDLLLSLREQGHVTAARCSTRPDALGGNALSELRTNGIDLVELGIQSFSTRALDAARRGYDRRTALEGCRAVHESGLKLGIQLLPGMPGCSPEVFLDDVRTALDLRPDCMRFYPCLVPEGTVLARWLADGSYAPWTLEETVSALGRALDLAWQAEVPVIRLSVAPESAFDDAVLAGPRHPALGALIQAEALLHAVERALTTLGRAPRQLVLPRFCQGFMYGDRGALRVRWESLGLGPGRISYHDGAMARLS